MFDEKRNRRSSTTKRTTTPVNIDVGDTLPESFDVQEFQTMPTTDDDEVEGIYLRLLKELVEDKTLTNRRSTQSKLRLL